jgi:hypothetical protein
MKPQLYATKDIWNMVPFIYFIKDEVVNKALKEPTTVDVSYAAPQAYGIVNVAPH